MHVDESVLFRILLSNHNASRMMELIKQRNGNEQARELKRQKCRMFYRIVLGCQVARTPDAATQDCGGDEVHCRQHGQYQTTSSVEQHAAGPHDG